MRADEGAVGREAERWRAACAVLVGVLSALVLVGWAVDVELLKSGLPGTVTTKPNTALGLLLAAGALALVGAPSRAAAAARVAAALGAALLGLSALVQDALGVDLGVDQLLFDEPDGAVATASPGRMAPGTGVALLLAGLALLRPAGLTAAAAGHALAALGVLGLLGYVYAVEPLYRVAELTAMSPATALALAVLGGGLVAATPDRGIAALLAARSAGGTAFRWTLPAALLVPVACGAVVLLGLRAEALGPSQALAVFTLVSIASLVVVAFVASRRVGTIDRELRIAHAETDEQRQLLSTTLASIGDAVVSTDGQGRVVFLNAVAAELTGWSPEDAVGRPVEDVVRVVHHGTREDAPNPVARALAAGTAVALAKDVVLVRRDGGEVAIDDSAAPIRDEDDDVVGAVLVFRDVGPRRRAERELRRSEERLRLLMEAVPMLVGYLDPEGRYRYANPVHERWLGLPSEALEGRLVREVLGEEAWAALGPAVAAARRGEGRELQLELRDARGESRWLQARLTPDVAEGRVAGFYVSMADVSSLKRAEEELRRKTDRLEEQDRRKDEFLAILGHELRNPLAALDSGVRVLDVGGVGGEEGRGAQRMMGEQVEHLARLVDDLLDVTRITRGKIELRKEVVELRSVVARAVEAVRPLLDQRGHELELRVDPPSLHLEVDPTRLEQVLVNLLSNAAKYTDPGGHVRLEATRVGDEARIAVQDDGAGLEPEALGRIFEPFTQLQDATSGLGGLGIGLTLVRQLVAMHGGSVEARSPGPGQGSTFVVRLPGVREAAAAPTSGGNGEGRPLAGLHVLVVDDNPDALNGTALLLGAAGCRVSTAVDGRSALASASAERPDAVLLDLGLPDVSGYEVARRLRADPALDGTLLIAVTGYGHAEARREAFAAGIEHHLTKPIDYERLFELLRGASAAPPSA